MDRLLRPVSKDESTVEHSSNDDSTFGPISDNLSTARPTSRVELIGRPGLTDASGDNESSVTFCSNNYWRLPNIDHDATLDFSEEDNSHLVDSDDANSIADLFSNDDAIPIGNKMEGDTSTAGSESESHNPSCISSGIETKGSESRALVSNNRNRGWANSDNSDADFDASKKGGNTSHSISNENQTHHFDKYHHIKRSTRDVQSDVVVDDNGKEYEDDLLDVDTDIEHFIGSLRTEIVCSNLEFINFYQLERLRFRNVHRSVQVLDFAGNEIGDLRWTTAALFRQILDQNLASVDGRLLRTSNLKTNRIPIEVRFHCKDRNIERLHTVLDESGLSLSNYQFLSSDPVDTHAENGMSLSNSNLDKRDFRSDSLELEEDDEYLYGDMLSDTKFQDKLDRLIEEGYEEDKDASEAEPSEFQDKLDRLFEEGYEEDKDTDEAQPSEFQDKLDRLFEEGYEEDKDASEAEPSEIIKTKLYTHQKEALYWMIEKENSDELPPFWKKDGDLFVNTLTDETTTEKPNSVKGGILADDMGLGKTLVIISLIASNTIEQCAATCTRKNKNNSLGDQSACSTADGDDQRPGCSNWSPKSVRQNPCRKRKHSESDTSGGYDYASDESSIFQKMKKKFYKQRNCSNSFGSEKQEQGSEVMDNSDSVIVISDDEEYKESSCFEENHVHRDENKDDKGNGSSILMSQLGPTPMSLKASKGTLVICPATVIATWKSQFKTHIHRRNKLKVYTFHGPSRITDKAHLAKQDVVLTTYGIVQADSKIKRILNGIEWYRIVLDEGHEIRNPSAKRSAAICELKSGKKWVLSGTPIQNNIRDLWSLVNFLEIHPLTDRKLWFQAIEDPLRIKKETAFRRLQHLICKIAMRRTKDILNLPKRTEKIQKLQFSEEEKAVYREMHDEAKPIISIFLDNEWHNDNLDPEWIMILIIMLRLRQMCCHPALFPKSKLAVAAMVALRGGIDEDTRHDLLEKLSKVLKSGNVECPICLDDWKTPVITPCKHVYCQQCIRDVLGTNNVPGVNSTCPMCREKLDHRQLVKAKPSDLEPDERIDISVENFKHSSKTRALIKALIKLRKEDPLIKSIVVSFFTSFLDIIEVPLRGKGFRFVRLDGRMTLSKREQSVSSFMNTEPGSPTIILLSLKAGGQGITLTAASRVFLMEPWFNPATEQQCFDRCHRLGQTKDVIITKFIMEESIEEGLLEVQKRKLELMRETFRKPTRKEEKLQNIQNVRTAFGL